MYIYSKHDEIYECLPVYKEKESMFSYWFNKIK